MIYIIRHGQKELNVLRVLQGRSDYSLNESGIRQAQEAGGRLSGISFREYWNILVRNHREVIGQRFLETVQCM